MLTQDHSRRLVSKAFIKRLLFCSLYLGVMLFRPQLACLQRKVSDASSTGCFVPGTHRPRVASSKERIVQGTHRPREHIVNVTEHPRLFVWGNIGRGHFIMSLYGEYIFSRLPAIQHWHLWDCSKLQFLWRILVASFQSAILRLLEARKGQVRPIFIN